MLTLNTIPNISTLLLSIGLTALSLIMLFRIKSIYLEKFAAHITVMGAALMILKIFTSSGSTDPLVFPDTDEVLHIMLVISVLLYASAIFFRHFITKDLFPKIK